ncbi:ABC transporter substrate-binding protein [Roseibium sp.]|uniref:ABC transporter substrate-binding protein n=1 Tax=Roseibium sp. TaxID=1936156 RepID=UPI003A979BBE
MKKLLLSAAVSALAMGASSAMAAEDCGSVTIAEMNWASAGAIAHIDKIILEEGYGCEVSLVTGDTMPTFTSMNEKGEPDMAPELWINAVREPLDKAVAEGELIIGGNILNEGGVEGWWVPTYIADKHNIKTVADAFKHPELFPGAEDSSKGAFFNCPSGWNCQITTGNLFKAFGGEEAGFELVDSGSAAGLDGSIARAFERSEGWLGYYWAPTAILGKYDMTLLDFEVPHDKAEWDGCTVKTECAEPKKNSWVASEVYTVVTKEFAEKAGVAMDYVKGRSWDNRTAGKVLAWMTDNQATNEDGAYYFLENHEDVWTKWVSPEVAEKIKAAL